MPCSWGRCGQWATELEGYFTRVIDAPEDERRKYMGRGRPRELKLARVRAPAAAAPAADRATARWSTSAALADALRTQARKSRGAVETTTAASMGAVAAQAAVPGLAACWAAVAAVVDWSYLRRTYLCIVAVEWRDIRN